MDNNTEQEVWKDVVGYEGLYKVSDKGNVFGCRRGEVMKSRMNKGYCLIKLTKDKKQKTCFVHRLVAEAFVENPDNKPEVNHLDENKINNDSSNLVWVTPKENSNWGTRNERVRENAPIKPVRKLNPLTNEVVKEYESVKCALIDMGVRPNNGTLSALLTGSRPGKTYKGYKWEYADEVAQ